MKYQDKGFYTGKKIIFSNSFRYPLLLIIGFFIAYYPVFNNQLIYLWDDGWQVSNHFTSGGLNWENLKIVFTQFYEVQYSPLNQLLYCLVYSISGYTPLGFHTLSLALHLASVILVYILLVKILTKALNKTHDDSTIELTSFLTALLFAVHPVQVESVAWVSASKILVYAFFYLLATYTYIRFLERKSYLYYLITILLFILSFGGKEQAVVFPIWLTLLYAIYSYKLLEKKVILHLLPFYLLSIFFGIITFYANGRGVLVVDQDSYSYLQRFVLASYSLSEYVTKWVFPVNLLYLYPFPFSVGESTPAWLYSYPVLIIILIFVFKKFFTRKIVLSGMLFFFIHVAFVLHIIPINRFVITADRYMYLAGIGLSVILFYYFTLFLNKSNKKYIYISIITLYFASLIVYTNVRCRTWHDSDSLKKEIIDLVKKRNNISSAYCNYHDHLLST